jgi:hypothetical protein
VSEWILVVPVAHCPLGRLPFASVSAVGGAQGAHGPTIKATAWMIAATGATTRLTISGVVLPTGGGIPTFRTATTAAAN